ncbi:ABC transporter permease subunit [Bradyrhizobium diversitatis]|uniref:ABC transporter permease subunit n=1 Tax=Bradyrhizobium diversitatis TaxID=2755406 RepID=A0ABS0NUS8_9BRAD|nr:ABC transporter permease subunit [Bradyrhizobium diversitatis]MBH5384760.1 ABC transporter permease subunit [Bradyrhizobium diversitatis]
MFAIIAAKDLRELARDGRLLWAGGLIVILMLVALAAGWNRQVQLNSERMAGQALDYDAWLHQGHRHPHDAAEQGMHVFKPEPPLSVFDPGIGPFVGSTVWLQAHRQSEVKFRPAQDATGLQRFGELSPAWLLQVLLPLLIIVIGFNSVSGERERGTLRQLLSLGVPARSLLLGKAAALASCVGLLIAPVGLAFAVLVVARLPAAERFDVVYRIAWLVAGYGFYLGIFMFLTLAVSALVRSSRAALVLLLGFWVAATLIAPRTASEATNLLYPTPSRLDFDNHLTRDLADAGRKAWSAHFGTQTPWDPSIPLSKWGAALKVDDEAGYGALDENFGRLWDTFERQQRAQEWVGLVAPVVALRGFSMGMAGTDFSQHRDFSTAAELQRRKIQDIVSEDLIEHADRLNNAHFTYKAGPELWARVPRFNYEPPPVSFALSHHWTSLALLAVMFCLSAALAQYALSRR